MLYLLLITIYLLLFTYLSWRKTDWAIYLLVLTLPSYLVRFHIGPIPTTLLECMILILFVVWLIKTLKQKSIKTIKQRDHETLKQWVLPITIFLLAATISIFISPHLRAAAGIWKAYFIEPILFLVVFVNTIDQKKLKSVFVISSFCVFVLSCFAIYQKLTGVFITNPFWANEATRRVTSIFSYPNALALFLAPLIILFMGYLISRLKHNKIASYQDSNLLSCYFVILLYSITIILGITAIYFTRSKGALIAILAGLIFYAIFHKPLRKYFLSILGIIFIFIFLYFYISKTPINLQGDPTVEGGGSLSTRTQTWSETWSMLKTKPIFGAGLAGYQAAVAPFHQKDYIEIYLYPHNIILNFWSEIGLLGLIAFIWIIILSYKTGFKTLQQDNKITSYQNGRLSACCLVSLLSGMTALLVHGIVDVPYFKNDLSILFWLIIGSLIILQQKQSKTFQPKFGPPQTENLKP